MVITAIYERNGNRPLFPNLHFLAWQRSTFDSPKGLTVMNPMVLASDTKLLKMLLTPTITAVAFWHPVMKPNGDYAFKASWASTEGKGEDIRVVMATCPRIKSVLLQSDFAMQSLTTFSQYTQLDTIVSHSNIPISVFRSLGDLPSLTTLAASVVSIDLFHTLFMPEMTPEPLPIRTLFPALKQLTLTSLLHLVPGVLSCIRSSAVHSLNTRSRVYHTVPHDQILDTFKTLQNTPFAHSLQTLHVSLAFDPPRRDADSVVFRAVFGPLFELAHLKTLTVHTHERTLLITSSDLDEMALSWPNLVTLGLTCRFDTDVPRRVVDQPTIHALVALAVRCERLKLLYCDAVDVTKEDVARFAEQADRGVLGSQQQLTGFVPARVRGWSGLSPEDTARLAVAVQKVFPNVEGGRALQRVGELREELRERRWDVRSAPRVCQFLHALDTIQAGRRKTG